MEMKKLDFIEGLSTLKQSARLEGKAELQITAGELHRFVGDYPPKKGQHHAMPAASDVLKEAVHRDGGRIIYLPPKGRGARVQVAILL